MTDPESVRSTADAMSAEQMREALAALGLTQAGGARLLGVDGRTMRRWCAEPGPTARDVPPTVARFLRFLVVARIEPDEVMKALAQYGYLTHDKQ